MKQEHEEIKIATITEIGADGVKILIDGDDTAGQKEYKVNCAVRFSVGDRVKITRNSGTYIVDYVIGSPMSYYPIPPGGTDGQYLIKNGADNYSLKWGDSPPVSELTSGNYIVTFNGSALYPSGTCSLGTNNNRFNGCYLLGSMYFGNTSSKLGFFGSTPIAQQAVSNSATVATLITTLKQYGLIR